MEAAGFGGGSDIPARRHKARTRVVALSHAREHDSCFRLELRLMPTMSYLVSVHDFISIEIESKHLKIFIAGVPRQLGQLSIPLLDSAQV